MKGVEGGLVDITRREVDYLKVINKLTESGDYASTHKIARHLNVKEPTVVEAVRRLSSKGYVVYVPRRGAILTDKGKALLINIKRRHRILETLLVRVLNLDLEKACDEASKLELYVSDELIDLMCRYLGHPRKCPHGYSIPIKVSCCSVCSSSSS